MGASGHYPAVDVLHSVSRVMPHIVPPEHIKASQKIREALACYERSSDLIQLGAYVAGTNPQLDVAVRNRGRMLEFLQQNSSLKAPLEHTIDALHSVAAALS